MRICRDCGTRFEPAMAHHKLCWRCFRARRGPIFDRGSAEVVLRAPVLDEAVLRDLLKLAHPDLHPPERALLATRTTQRLLEALELVRGTGRLAA